LNVARFAHKWLKESQGMLVLFSSSSYTRGRSGSAVYSASKSAIVNLTQSLSEEWLADGIRVNCIVPGRTDTNMRAENFKNELQCSLASPYDIGLQAIYFMGLNITGQIFRATN
jgi:2-C-methyl-D-erythritol 4-phosphate cytidylyltransferase